MEIAQACCKEVHDKVMVATSVASVNKVLIDTWNKYALWSGSVELPMNEQMVITAAELPTRYENQWVDLIGIFDVFQKKMVAPVALISGG